MKKRYYTAVININGEHLCMGRFGSRQAAINGVEELKIGGNQVIGLVYVHLKYCSEIKNEY